MSVLERARIMLEAKDRHSDDISRDVDLAGLETEKILGDQAGVAMAMQVCSLSVVPAEALQFALLSLLQSRVPELCCIQSAVHNPSDACAATAQLPNYACAAATQRRPLTDFNTQ